MAKISERGQNVASTTNIGDRFEKLFHNNKYHETKNPLGVIDLGSADNKICEDLLLEKLRTCDVPLQADHLYYSTNYGTLSLREAAVKFMKEIFNAKYPISADNIVAVSGVNTGLENLVYCVTEQGDSVLVPTPCWDKIPRVLADRCHVNMEPVPLHAQNGYLLTPDQLEESYTRASSQGKKVTAMLLINPNNPLGILYTPQQLTDILGFAKSHSLHVILDEIYALSVHSPGDDHHGYGRVHSPGDDHHGYSGVLSLETLPDPERTHVAWGVSKDLGLSGYRCGFLVTTNQRLVHSLRALCFYGQIPARTQATMAWLLSQTDWFSSTYLPAAGRRLSQSCAACVSRLTDLRVTVTPPQAGLFVWVNMSKYLSSPTVAAETRLTERFIAAGVYFRPGQIFSARSPGYFRIVCAHSEEVMAEALKRIEAVLTSSDVQDAVSSVANSLALDLDFDDIEVVDVGTKKGGPDNMEDLLRSLKQTIHASDWLNPDTPQREAQERVWTVLDPSGVNPTVENPVEENPVGEIQAEKPGAMEASGGAEGGGSETLEDLMRSLKQNMKASDWLQDSGQNWESQNPEAAQEYRAAMKGDGENVECKTQ